MTVYKQFTFPTQSPFSCHNNIIIVLSFLMATLSCTSVASSAAAGASHKSGSYIVDGYTNRSSMGLSTSAQPTSTAGELYHQG